MTAAFDFDVPPFDTLNAAQQALVRATASLVRFAAGRPGADAGDGADPRLPAGRRPCAARGRHPARGHLRRRHAVRRTRAAVGARQQQLGGARRGARLADPEGDAAVAAVGQPGLLRRGVRRDRAPPVEAGGAQRAARVPVADDGARARRLSCASPSTSTARSTWCRCARSWPSAGQSNALVRDGERIGMFTTTDLRDALLRRRRPGGTAAAAVAVREVARFELISVNADGELFEALLLMIRHRVHRVLVRDGDGHRRRAQPARPDELRLQPLAPDRAAGRAGRAAWPT